MLCFKRYITISGMLLVTLLVPISGKAQADDSKFEVGVQLSMLGNRGDIFIPDSASLGGGGRLTYNYNRYRLVEPIESEKLAVAVFPT